MEIDQESESPSAQFQVCQELCSMHREQGIYRLHFYDDAIGNDKVEPVAALQSEPLIGNGQRLLTLEGDPPQEEFPS